MNLLTAFPGGKGTFARGIHPPEHKNITAESPIEVFPAPGEILIPLQQHLGAASNPLVKARAEVQCGDVIAEAAGFISCAQHAGGSGTVGRPKRVTLPNGRHVDALPIQLSEEQPHAGRDLFNDLYRGDWLDADLAPYAPETIAEAAKQAGLVGLGGAAFPTHVKLLRNEQKPCDTVLINGCECEPYLNADHRIMIEAARAVVAGARLAKQATGAAHVYICVEDNKPHAIEALGRAAEGSDAKVLVMKTKYPQGGEKQLIHAATGREVPFGGLPLDVGVVVLNVGTTAALARAVLAGKPLTHRVISITGRGIGTPKNLLVPIGTYYQDIIDYCGGLTVDAARVVSGGPMMGFTVGELNTPITKGTSGITVLTRADVEKAEETACVRCGRCVDVCPMKLVPSKLGMAARARDTALAEHFYINACMECGCCAYTCPASLPLVQLIRMGKVAVRNANKN